MRKLINLIALLIMASSVTWAQDKKSSTFQKWSPRCVFRKVSLSAGVSTISEESNAVGLVTNGITDKQRKSMTSVVFDHI